MADAPASTAAINVFISYAHEDGDLLKQLVTHLANLQRQGIITASHDRQISAGQEWREQIHTHLHTAQIILLLISADFMASDFCNDIELKRAIERHDAGEARVIPIILRPVDWRDTTFDKLQALPTDGKPVTMWSNRDEAWLNVVRGIRYAIEALRQRPSDTRLAGDQTCAVILKGTADDSEYQEIASRHAAAFTNEILAKFGGDSAGTLETSAVPHDAGRHSAALKHVRYLSEIAAQDAGLIAEDPGGVVGGEVCLDQDLYVTRSVEQEIHNCLATTEHRSSSLVLVVGEAGYGKTSLLWHFHRTLNASDGWEPWFVKSTAFLRQAHGAPLPLSATTATLSADELTLAVEAAQAQGRRPIVLLDTVDLLLRTEEERDGLIELLSILSDQDCSVIATCRPQEASLLRPTGATRADLRQYDETELAEAVDKHVDRFYADLIPRKRAEHIQNVRDAVACGLPLREVCTNPLTLRMVFTLYAPNPVPPEIHIFKLYQEYWDARVVQDRRAGSSISPASSANLETTAHTAALAMLAEGTPELEIRLLSAALRKLGGFPEELPGLISRGVLHRSGVGTVSFFHQTFFEHSAARGMLRQCGHRGLSVLDERIRSCPNDLFLSPIYEQALLLSETEIAPISQKADAALLDLIRRESQSAESSAIYVYSHRQTVSDILVSAVKEMLADTDNAVIDRFLDVVPNIAMDRLQELFAELDIIWDRDTWEEQEHVLDLLERLAVRSPALVKSYFERHQVLSQVLEKPPAGFPGDRKLLQVLTILVKSDPEWSWDWMIRLYTSSLPRARSRDLQTIIINTLCENASIFGANKIATDFEAATPQEQQDDVRGFSKLSRAYGNLWAIEWRATERPITNILDEIATLDDGLSLRARMKGLADILLEANETEVAIAFSRFKGERETFRQWLWANSVLPQLLGGCREPAAQLDSCSGDDIPLPAVRYVRKEAARIFAEWNVENASELPIRIRDAVQQATLPPQTLLELLDCEWLSSPNPWLDEAQLAGLLVQGFLAGHPGAKKAIGLLIENPGAYHKKVIFRVSSVLADHALTNPQVLDAHFALTLKVGDVTRLLRTIDKIFPPPPSELIRRRVEINTFRKYLVESTSGKERRSGVSLWIHLLRLDLSSPPPFEELCKRIGLEEDPAACASIATLIGQSAAKGVYDIDAVVGTLLPLAKGKGEALREKAFSALMTALTEAPVEPSAFALIALEAALTPPTNAGRLSSLGRLIDRLLPDNVELAATLLERLVSAPEIAGLKAQAKRTFTTRLRKPVRALVRVAPRQVQEHLLDAVIHLDRFLGRMIIDAVCHEVFALMARKLDSLLGRPDVPSKIKKLIHDHKYNRERTVGGESWPELYSLIEDSMRQETARAGHNSRTDI